MKIDEILQIIRDQAKYQGFYGRLYEYLMDVKNGIPDTWNSLVSTLESKNFKEPLDVVLYFEQGEKSVASVVTSDKSLANEMIEKYGENAQLDIVVEELSELTKEVIKYKRTKTHGEPYDIHHMAEELADAYVVLDIVQAVLNNYGITKEDIKRIVDYKKQRTRERYLK